MDMFHYDSIIQALSYLYVGRKTNTLAKFAKYNFTSITACWEVTYTQIGKKKIDFSIITFSYNIICEKYFPRVLNKNSEK